MFVLPVFFLFTYTICKPGCLNLQSELYELFKEQHLKVKLCIRRFELLTPTCIHRLKERNTFCCVKHEQAELYRKAFNNMRTKMHVNCTCSCNVCAADSHGGICQAPSQTFPSVSTLWRAIVCEKVDGEEWHRLDCVKGDLSVVAKKKFSYAHKKKTLLEPKLLIGKCTNMSMRQPKKELLEE